MDKNVIGDKISTLCTDKGITYDELSERSGLSKQQIENLETSERIPALSQLIKISRALGVRIGTFLDDSTELGAVIHRKDSIIKPVTFSSQLSNDNSHLHFTALAANKAGRNMEPFIIDINTESEPTKHLLSTHEGEEFLYVLEGTLEVVYGNEVYVLHEGESIYYDSIVDHLLNGLNGQKAKILAVIYTPI